MSRVLFRKGVALAVLGVMTGGIAVLEACSSSSSPASSNGPDAAAGNDGGSTNAACTSTTALSLLFSPMYSAYDGTNTYQIPVIVNGMTNDSSIKWSASPATAVDIAMDPITGGAMLTMKDAPSSPVTITANLNGQCGTSQLNVTKATVDQYNAGKARYNSSTPVIFQCIFGFGRVPEGGCPDAGPGCIGCHGPSAMAQFGFQDIAHTPEQTGGFSDPEMIDIITKGIVPGCGDGGACLDGGYFDPSIISLPPGSNFTAYEVWQSFHHWDDIQGSDQEAMVVYLRSLTPSAQDGTSSFGGRRDGGRREGGRREGGFPPPADGSTVDGATPTPDAAGE